MAKKKQTTTNLSAANIEINGNVAKSNVIADTRSEPLKDTVEVPIEAVLGALINAVNNQTAILEELARRIPPLQKPKVM